MFRIPPALSSAAFQVLNGVSTTAQEIGAQADHFALRHSLYAYANALTPRALAGAERIFGVLEDIKARVQTSGPYVEAYFAQFPNLSGHPSGEILLELLPSPTTRDAEGFTKISESAFRRFTTRIPHLFSDGQALLKWFDELSVVLRLDQSQNLLPAEMHASFERSAETFRSMVLTAAVTAPSDLWLMRQILATHAKNGLLDILEQGHEVITREDAPLFDMDEAQLFYDLEFLHNRGVLDRFADGYAKSHAFPFRLGRSLELPNEFRIDLSGLLKTGFSGTVSAQEQDMVERWLRIPSRSGSGRGWMPGRRDLELGYRILPVVLGLKAAGLLQGLKEGHAFPKVRWSSGVETVLSEAGFLIKGRVSSLGARAFERGPGAYGIIGAYYPYLNQHDALLRNTGGGLKVDRGPNIAASRDANRKNFQTAVEILDDYAQTTGTRYGAVIEHALGLGIGVQEFIKKFGTADYRFFGVDYEAAALQGAMREQAEGRLPQHMKYLQADIARPRPLIEYLKGERVLDTNGKQPVMIVGNGFHEARGRSDDEMIVLLKEYRAAGLLIVFTEESGLTGNQIRSAAWNTYHAGFRWTHQTSGQALRAPWPMDPPSERLSWTEVFEHAGYRVPREFRRGTRPLFPCDLPEERNPPISATFLCIP